jgi:hypothetical protein
MFSELFKCTVVCSVIALQFYLKGISISITETIITVCICTVYLCIRAYKQPEPYHESPP